MVHSEKDHGTAQEMKAPFFALALCFVHVRCAAQLPDTPQPVPFFHNKVNVTLTVSDVAVRYLDALSTRQAITDPCHCFNESGSFYGLDLSPVAAHSWSQYSYSLGFAGLNVLISRALWNRGERKHRTRYRWLSRAVLTADLATDGYATIHNWVEQPASPKGGFHRFGR